MDHSRFLFIIKGEIADNIHSFQREGRYTRIIYDSGKDYPYNRENVRILSNPKKLDLDNYEYYSTIQKINLYNIKFALEFVDGGNFNHYYRFFFKNGTFRSYYQKQIIIRKNALLDIRVSNVMDYLREIANITGLKLDDGTNILKEIYNKLEFIDSDSILKKYLCSEPISKIEDTGVVIYPFGSNLSQMRAVENALHNSISIIEGPPGTGKTQTILNIIANLLIRNKTVAIVSNNNSATDNVFEKLQHYGYEYIAAQLGSGSNKKTFIDSKQTSYPDFKKDIKDGNQIWRLESTIKGQELSLKKLFKGNNKKAQLQKELSEYKTEQKYFDQFFDNTYTQIKLFKRLDKVSSDKILDFWIKLQSYIDKEKPVSWIYKLYSVFAYQIAGFDVYKRDTIELIQQLKKLYYIQKIAEIEKEIKEIDNFLVQNNFDNILKSLSDTSNTLLKAHLASKYGARPERNGFEESIFFNDPYEFISEYPVILSTTYSIRSSLHRMIYDYVIVDESSQVDLATGALAMSCAKNIVIVGDLKQLPNVIPDKVRNKIQIISENNNIPMNYRFENNNLLSSAYKTFPNVPSVLLREHYRCHPKIIEFCNSRFYNDQLIIMTQDKGEKDVMEAIILEDNNHGEKYSNKKQVDEIAEKILPSLCSKDYGIIAPFGDQVEKLKSSGLGTDVEIATVHKFQGREKDDIIISTVQQEITDFTDKPELLNVAVSRAKRRLRVVVSNYEANKNTNIGSLVKYIKYNNFEIKRGEVFSVFDLLCKGYEKRRKQYLEGKRRVSEYDSENIMYTVIEQVLQMEQFSEFDVVTHQPLNAIISDPYKLNDKETLFAMNPMSHVDFLIYNKIDKSPVLAVEVDGYTYHDKNARQQERDGIKDTVFEKYNIPLIRFNTTGSGEKEKLINKLSEILGNA